MLVDDDGRRRVRGLNVEDADPDVRLGNEPVEPVGQVDEFCLMARSQRDARVAPDTRGRERVHR